METAISVSELSQVLSLLYLLIATANGGVGNASAIAVAEERLCAWLGNVGVVICVLANAGGTWISASAMLISCVKATDGAAAIVFWAAMIV